MNENSSMVKAPQHYRCPSGKELDEEMIDMLGVESVMNFYECNAIKYLKRHTDKNGEEDLLKAIECIDKLRILEYGKIVEGV